MSVPAIDTSKIGTFSWWKQSGTTEVALADCLGILHSYNQYPEYVDGTIKIFDTGVESLTPDNYVLVNIRVRSDGYVLAWFNKELTPLTNQTVESATTTVITMSGTKCQIQNYHDSASRDIVINELSGNTLQFTSGALNGENFTIQSNTPTTITLHDKYSINIDTDVSGTAAETFRIYSSRGNLVWWGHTSGAEGDPTNQSTRLGRSIYEIWETLKGNQVGGDGAVVDYTQINYYDYEYTSAQYLYMLGYNKRQGTTQYSVDNKYWFSTIPNGRTIYDSVLNVGVKLNSGAQVLSQAKLYIDSVLYHGATYGAAASTGSATIGYFNIIYSYTPGIQKTIRQYLAVGFNYNYQYMSAAATILTD